MGSSGELAVYFAIVFGIVLLPGMDMAFVLGNSLAGGRGAGLAAVAGVIAGGLCHVAMGTAGVALVLQLVPGLFALMLLVGSAYVAWLGWSLLRATRGAAPAFAVAAPGAARPRAAFAGAMLTNLLNPKAYLFTLAVLPQFMHPDRGSIAAQAALLALITSATQAGVYGTLALLAARSRAWLQGHARANRIAMRAVALLLIGTAVFTALQGWRGAGAATRPSQASLVCTMRANSWCSSCSVCPPKRGSRFSAKAASISAQSASLR